MNPGVESRYRWSSIRLAQVTSSPTSASPFSRKQSRDFRPVDGGKDKGRTRVEYANGSVRTVKKTLVIFMTKPRPEPGSRVFVPEKPTSTGINWIAVTAVVTSFATVYALLFK
jgi:hypothetical protein